MLYGAATWRPGPRRFSASEVPSLPEIAVYISGWGRPGDEGLIAEAETGEPVGAAWYRLFSQEAHGFGFVNAETPELTIAVRQDLRGRGIGSALLAEPIERAAFRVIQRDKVLTMIRALASVEQRR